MLRKLLLIGLIAVSSFVNGQNPPPPIPEGYEELPELSKEKREKLKVYKIAFITEKLSLTAEEAKKFWPVYDGFQNKKEGLRKEMRKKRKAIKGKKNLTDAEMEAFVDAEMKHKAEMVELEQKFHADVKKVLPIKKVFLLYKAERQFKKSLMKRIKRGPPGGRRGRGRR